MFQQGSYDAISRLTHYTIGGKAIPLIENYSNSDNKKTKLRRKNLCECLIPQPALLCYSLIKIHRERESFD